MWIAIIAIAIPFLFLIGTIYSAIKDQKRLENGPLKDIIAKKKEQRVNNLNKVLEQNKYQDKSLNGNDREHSDISDQGHLLSRFEILDNNNRARRDDPRSSIKDIDKIKKIDSLLNKLDTMQKTQNTQALKIKPNAFKNNYPQNTQDLKKDDFIKDSAFSDNKVLNEVTLSSFKADANKSDILNENEFLKAYKEQDLEAKKLNIKNFVKTPKHVFDKNAKDIIDKLDRAIDEVSK